MPSTATQITQITGSAAGSIAPAGLSSAVAGAAGISTSAATAMIGGGVAAVVLGITAWLNRAGPKQKVATTKMVDEVEPLLKQNVQEYLNGPRTPESQAVALKNF